jgi:hypothetical protein
MEYIRRLTQAPPTWRMPPKPLEALERGPTSDSISLYFDLDNFGPGDIADIIGLLSELYVDLGGDGLVIDDIALLDFQPAFEPVEV